jgi:hypothetical protein
VVGDDCANIERQQAASPAEQQIIQAVAELGRHDEGGKPAAEFNHCCAHGNLLRHRLELRAQCIDLRALSGKLELDMHEKEAHCHVAKLRGLHDVGATLEKKTRYRVNNAGTDET